MSAKSTHKVMKQKLLAIARYLDSRKVVDPTWYGDGLDFLMQRLGTLEIVHF